MINLQNYDLEKTIKKQKINEIHTYSVYMCKNKTSQKLYFEITNVNSYDDSFVEKILTSNAAFSKDMMFDDFELKFLYTGMKFHEAIVKKRELIKKYDSIKCGYNTIEDLEQTPVLDCCDYKVFKKKEKEYILNDTLFTKIPNEFIRISPVKQYNVHPVLNIVYMTIGKNKTYDNISKFSIGEILGYLNIDITQAKRTKIYYEIIKSILFLRENNYIECEDIHKKRLKADTMITVKLISDNFEPSSNFTILTNKEFNKLVNLKCNCKKENIISVFLYVKSFIGNKNQNSMIVYPRAFYKSIEKSSNDLNLSDKTVKEILNVLSEGSNSLLVKHELNKENSFLPNIYVLREFGYEEEIMKAKKHLYSFVRHEDYYDD